MSLTGKGSTNKPTASVKTSLLAKKKKKGFIERVSLKLGDMIKGPALSAGNNLSAIANSNEMTALGQTLSRPDKIISQGLKDTSIATGKGGDYLQKIGKQAEDSKIPVISQAGSITRAAGTLASGPEQTRKNVIQIRDNVRDGKITMFDGLLEGSTSAGLQGITTIAAPFLQAINSGLNITGLDEPLEDSIESGTNFLVDFTGKSLGISKEKATSRVNSGLNILRGLGMYKGGKIINKGGTKNFIKGSTVISSPDIALSVLAFAAKEEKKPMPTVDKVKGFAANSGLAFVGRGKKITNPKVNKSLTESPKPTLTEILDSSKKQESTKKETKEPELPKELKVKETEENKKSLNSEKVLAENKGGSLQDIINKTTPSKKTNIKTGPKITETLKELQTQKTNLEAKVKTNPDLRTQLREVYAKIEAKQKNIKSTEPRNKKADIFTEEAPTKDFGTPIKADTPIKKQPKFTKKRIKFTKELVQNIVNEKRDAKAAILTGEKSKIDANQELIQKNRMDEILDTADTFTEKELVKNIYEDTILSDESKISLIEAVETKGNTLTNIIDKNIKTPNEVTPVKKGESFIKEESLFDDTVLKYQGEKLVTGESVHLNVLTKALDKVRLNSTKDFLIDNIDGFLKTIVFVNKEGNRSNLADKVNAVKTGTVETVNRVATKLGFDELKAKVESNTVLVNDAYNSVKKTYKGKIGTDTAEGRLRIGGIEDAIKDTSLYAKTVGVQGINFSKFSVVSNFVFGEVKARIEHFKKSELDKIIEGKNYSKKAIDEIKQDIEITSQDIINIKESVLSEMPKNSQEFLRDIMNKHGQFDENTTMTDGFKAIGEELVEIGVLDGLKENYTHGYITYEMLRRYAKESNKSIDDLAKDFGINVKDLDLLADGTEIVPESISSILKSKSDIWALHSQDPLSIMYSYANESARLMEQKQIIDILEYVKNADEKTRIYLKKYLPREDNYKLKRILGLGTASGNNGILTVAGKGARPIATGLSYLAYVGNPKLILQNAAFAALKGTTKVASDVMLREGSYSDRRIITENNQINDYLFNKGLLSHKITDVNKSVKGNVGILQKAAGITKKLTFNEALKQSTSFSVGQWQSFVAGAYMKKIINSNGFEVKKGDTIVSVFKELMEGKTEKEKATINAELKNTVDYIENTSGGAAPSTKAFTNPIQGMVKMFSRGQISNLAFNVSDIIDATVSKIKQGSLKKDKKGKVIEGEKVNIGKDISRNSIHLGANLVLYIAAYKLVADMLFDSDEEKEDFVNYMYGENVQKVLVGYASNKFGVPGFNMLADTVGKINKGVVEVMNIDGSKEKLEALGDMTLSIANGLNKGIDSINRIGGEEKAYETAGGAYKFTDSESTGGFVGELLGMNPSSSGYTKAQKDIFEATDKLDKGYSKVISDIIKPFRKLTQKVNNMPDEAALMVFRTEVENMNNRIKSMEGEVLTFEQFVDNALGEDFGERGDQFKKNLSEKVHKSIPANKKVLLKLDKVLKTIKSSSGEKINDNDFNGTLNELRDKNPRLYRAFYAELYNSVGGEGLKTEISENRTVFIDNVIYKDMGGKLLSSAVTKSIKKLTDKIIENDFTLNNKIASEYNKLKILNESLELIPEELKTDLFNSVSQLVNEGITNDNLVDIRKAVKEFPQIEQLYKRAAELRGAVLFDNVEKGVEKTEEISNIAPEPIINNGTVLGKQAISSEKKIPVTTKRKANGKLIDLINLKQEKKQVPEIKTVDLKTLLDKVL